MRLIQQFGGLCLLTNPETTSAEKPKRPKVLFGYAVTDLLGEGAGSTIYKVHDRKSGQEYALKHVVRKTDRDLRYVQQLENEFAVSRQFRHPGLRRYIECKVTRNLFRRVTGAGLVMELINGVPLDQQRPGELPGIIDCFIQTAKALAGLHYLLFVHCDLKPNNIIVDAQGIVKLIDFGQACRIGTIKERIQGTPDFIAPEQVKLRPVTIRTDVYNFGATLYWALSGHRMPTLYTVKKDQRDIVWESKFPSPRDLNPLVPVELSDLVMQCVKVDPPKRPADMAEIIGRLESVGKGR